MTDDDELDELYQLCETGTAVAGVTVMDLIDEVRNLRARGERLLAAERLAYASDAWERARTAPAEAFRVEGARAQAHALRDAKRTALAEYRRVMAAYRQVTEATDADADADADADPCKGHALGFGKPGPSGEAGR